MLRAGVEISAPRVEGGGEDGKGKGGRPCGQRRSWRASEVSKSGGGGACSEAYSEEEEKEEVIDKTVIL